MLQNRRPLPKWESIIDFVDCTSNRECKRCWGRGKITDDKSDCIEGHKLSYFYECPTCKGRGLANEEEISERWDKYKKEVNLSQKAFDKKLKLALNVIKKLSQKELEILNDFVFESSL